MMEENKIRRFSCPSAYEFEKREEIEELKSVGYLLRHKKSGARVLLMQNEDENKVFSIGFRTPPKDSTGAAHIVEHTVLCGSQAFPSKDPFVELAKGSLNTFLNAMTYPDKTLYPVASVNDKDFKNLMHVYLDAVFYPNIYKEEKIFKQEGWHYELESPDGEITCNGVVYSEMKGVYSSPEQRIFSEIARALYPESVYGKESGGDPADIPKLSYEEFLDFHRQYYHPGNSYIYLYGDMDFEEKLEFMDREYLSRFDRCESCAANSEITMQEPFRAMRHAEAVYPVAEGEDLANKTYLAYASVVGNCLDEKLSLAFQVLEYVLLDTPGAPLKKALYDAELGSDVLNAYENGMLQPMFAIIVKETEAEKAEQFLKVLQETLAKIIEDGIPEDSLKAAINMLEFRYREADFGAYPKGLIYGIQMLESWLYEDSQPFLYSKTNQTFAFLKEQIGTGYYEGLIRQYLLDNQHSILLVMSPEAGLTEKTELHLKETLKKYKESLSEEEILSLAEETKALHAYQQEPSSREDLEKIPMLSVSDIKREIEPLHNKEISGFGCRFLHHELETNGIGYFDFLFDMTDIELERAPMLSFLSSLLGEVATRSHSLLELSNEIDIHTGGIGLDTQIFSKIPEKGKEGGFFAAFDVKIKSLFPEFGNALSLLDEVLFHSVLEDEKRLKEILGEERSRMQMFMTGRGDIIASTRALSYHSRSACFNEMTDGVGYYRVIDDYYCHFEEKKNGLMEELKQLIVDFFSKDRLLISFTGNQEAFGSMESALRDFLEKIPEEGKKKRENLPEKIKPEKKNEGFMTAGQVQYVARSGNFRKDGFEYTGALRVLKTVLSFDYLWNQVRVLGGAYDSRAGFGRNGSGYFVSYRDPNLARTNEVFEKTGEYIRNFSVDQREMEKYIIGTISSMDMPLTPAAKGSRSLGAYLSGVTESLLKKEREEVLHADEEKIRSLAPLVESILASGEVCVVGGRGEIERSRELFMNVEKLC